MAILRLQKPAFVTYADVERAIERYGLPTSVHSFEEAQMYGNEAIAHAAGDKYGPQIAVYFLQGIIDIDVIEEHSIAATA